MLINSLHVCNYAFKNQVTKVIDNLLLIKQKITFYYYQLEVTKKILNQGV